MNEFLLSVPFQLNDLNSVCLFIKCNTSVLGASGCSVNNGNCTQLCFPLGSLSVRCACAMGFELAADGKTCKSVDTFLIYSTATGSTKLSPKFLCS